MRVPGVVVVNYRTAALTLECVASLRADGVEEIVVVDSASGDDCQARLAAADPDARFVGLTENRGYGAAGNAGARHIESDVVIISNSDLVVVPGSMAALRAAFDGDPRLGLVGPRVDRVDGTRYPSARSFPSLTDAVGHGFVGLVTEQNPWSRRYLRPDAEERGPVDWVSGAFMAFRREAFEAVGGFDESYFMFLEEVDVCRRLHVAGWGVAYEPDARVVHREGEARATAPYRMIVAHHASLLRYAWRNGSRSDRALIPVVAVGLGVRTVILSARTAWRARQGA